MDKFRAFSIAGLIAVMCLALFADLKATVIQLSVNGKAITPHTGQP